MYSWDSFLELLTLEERNSYTLGWLEPLDSKGIKALYNFGGNDYSDAIKAWAYENDWQPHLDFFLSRYALEVEGTTWPIKLYQLHFKNEEMKMSFKLTFIESIKLLNRAEAQEIVSLISNSGPGLSA